MRESETSEVGAMYGSTLVGRRAALWSLCFCWLVGSLLVPTRRWIDRLTGSEKQGEQPVLTMSPW